MSRRGSWIRLQLWECEHHLGGDGSNPGRMLGFALGEVNPPKILPKSHLGFHWGWCCGKSQQWDFSPGRKRLWSPSWAILKRSCHGSSNPVLAACRLREAEQGLPIQCALCWNCQFVFPNLPFPCLSHIQGSNLDFFRQEPAQHLWVGAAILEHLEVNLISTFGKLCSKLQC